MEEDLLCPFHYFGITDITINGNTLDDATEFRYLVSDLELTILLIESNFMATAVKE